MLVAGERLDDATARHDDDAVAQALELLGVGGRHDDWDTARRDLAQDPVDLGPRTDVDALGRLVGDHDGRLGQQGPGQDDLLLVAAGQRGDGRLAGRAS